MGAEKEFDDGRASDALTGLLSRLDALAAARHTQKVDPARLPFPDRAPGTDCLEQVRHIIILMMENHSFDNYLGHLDRGDGLRNMIAGNPGPCGTVVPATHLPSTVQEIGVPTQSWGASHLQWAGGANTGFATAVAHCTPGADPRIAMGYWTEEDLPFYYALARTFPVADRWFSSCLGPTIPNRRFLLAGTAHGLTTDRVSHCFDYPPNGTIFDLLTRHNISWTNYHSVSRSRPLLRRLSGAHGLRAARFARRGLEDVADRLRKKAEHAKSYLQFTADAYPAGIVRYVQHLRTIDDFERDAAAGTLPSVSIVDPDFRANSEENPQDIRAGQAFAARVINAAMQGARWLETLLVWCYDEHGGYYDHVPPPEAVEPGDAASDLRGPYRFNRYGFRVPAVIVSPYARPNYVSHVTHDHTSLLKLIERKWNLPPLTERDAAADDLLDSLDFGAPPAFATPPDLGFTDCVAV